MLGWQSQDLAPDSNMRRGSAASKDASVDFLKFKTSDFYQLTGLSLLSNLTYFVRHG